MVPFDVVTGRDYMVSQSARVTILCESLKLKCSVFLSCNRRFVLPT